MNEHLEDPEAMEEAIEGVEEMLEEEQQPEQAGREENQEEPNPQLMKKSRQLTKSWKIKKIPTGSDTQFCAGRRDSPGAQEHKGGR